MLNIIMWVLWGLIGLILLLVVVALFAPIDLFLSKENGKNFACKIKVFGIKIIDSTPKAKKKKNKNIEKKEQSKKKKAKKVKKSAQDYIYIIKIVFDALGRLGFVLKHCTFKRFKLHLICAGPDAAEAAISYGTAAAVVYPFVGILENRCNLSAKNTDVDLACDYEKSALEFSFEIAVHACAFYLICAALYVLLRAVKNAPDKGRKTPKARKG